MQKKNKSSFVIDLDKFFFIHGNPSFLRKIKYWLVSFELHCLAVFRFVQYSRNLYKKSKIIGIIPCIISYIFQYQSRLLHHVNIDSNAQIGPGFYILHASSIFIGANVKIGSNCNIHHNITIGQRVASGDRGVPVIGNDVWIGTGVIMSGDITIGDNSTISSGCVLSKSVPEKSLVAGNPGRIILKGYDNSKFFAYKINNTS